VAAEIERMRWITSLYIGGMGAPELNFHAQVYRRMGYEKEVDEIGTLFQAGKKAEAAAAVPDELVLETAIIGNEAQVREQIGVWEASGVTMLLVSVPDVDQLKRLAPLLDAG